MTASSPVLDLGPAIQVLPAVYGSADSALVVVERLQAGAFDCIAVALPPSFAAPVEAGVGLLPRVGLVLQAEAPRADGKTAYNYVPVDPCQPLIAALRYAVDADIPRAFVDQEVAAYEPYGHAVPDPYALKEIGLEAFLAALLPGLKAPQEGSQRQARLRRMAYELHRLELEYQRIAFVCAVWDWPWIRQAYRQRAAAGLDERGGGLPQLYRCAPASLYFALGELPYTTYLYERQRAEMTGRGTLGVDGIKTVLLEARDSLEAGRESLTPQRLGLLLRYVRNLTLLDGRLTPDLYNLALAAKQVAGDAFALQVVHKARDYPPQRLPSDLGQIHLGPDGLEGQDEAPVPCHNRLEGMPRQWRALPLKPEPPAPKKQRWSQTWDPFGQCSYLPEDRRIESFQQHVRQQARSLVGNELARVEKFTASLKDGLDLRETLRHWHSGELYVRELPPARGDIEVVVFIFETPADTERFAWRSTWYAEHEEESTLSFFATPFTEQMVGPGIGQAQYGGCFFLFPPRPLPDIWQDRRLDFARSLEERLIAGACLHSRQKRVALVAPVPPSAAWRRVARRFKKQLVFLPLKRFSGQLVERLRRFHVLNGKQVRSYAARYIRDLR